MIVKDFRLLTELLMFGTVCQMLILMLAERTSIIRISMQRETNDIIFVFICIYMVYTLYCTCIVSMF